MQSAIDSQNRQSVPSEMEAWDNPSNLGNPLNWPSFRKWINVTLVSAQAMLSAICSTIIAPGSVHIAKQFHLTSTYTPNLPIALYVLGLAIGPLCLGPMSEVVGRRNVYLTSFLLFTALNAGCAASPNIVALSVLRLAAGTCGSAGPTLGGATVGDMFSKEKRGKAQALYALGPALGPIIGPLIGAFVVDRTHSWRWPLWVLVIASGVVTLCSTILLKETYTPSLLRRQKQETPGNAVTIVGFLTNAALRPMQLLFLSPICTITSLYMALVFGVMYLHLVTVPLLYGPEPVYGLFSYEWKHGLEGLAYLGAGVGSVVGSVICAKFLNRSYAWIAEHQLRRTGNQYNKPESRMLFLQIGMCFVPVGLVVFAWTAEKRRHWVFPLLGATIFATGMLMAFVCIQTYLVDVYGTYSASALAAMTTTRSIGSFCLSFVGFQLFHSLGYGWGTMVVAFLSLAALPLPLVMYRFGPYLRGRDSRCCKVDG